MDFPGTHQIINHSPLTFTKGEFQGFHGFGDRKQEAIEAIIPYCENRELKTEKSPEDFWDETSPLVEDHLFLDQEVTDIQWSGKDIKKVIFNGQTEISGQSFYFFDRLPFLFEKLGPQLKKTVRQFSKIKWYSSVNLIIHHRQKPKKFDLDQIYLLMGLKKSALFGNVFPIQQGTDLPMAVFFPFRIDSIP